MISPQPKSLAARAPTQPQIPTLYLLKSVPEAGLVALANTPSLIAVTMPRDRVPFQITQVRAATGKPVFSHGYPWMVRSELILRLAQAFGVTGFYKDGRSPVTQLILELTRAALHRGPPAARCRTHCGRGLCGSQRSGRPYGRSG